MSKVINQSDFSTTDPMKILGLCEEGLILEFLYNLIIFSHIKCILEMARNRVLGRFIYKKTTSLSNCLVKPL